MTNKEILDATFCEVFRAEKDELTDLEFGSKNWDSIGHIRLIEELENKFGISVSPDDMMKMGTYNDVKKVLEGSYGVVF